MMEGFAAWLAKLMAAGAALLAAVWIWQGLPLEGAARDRAIDRCVYGTQVPPSSLLNPLLPHIQAAEVRRPSCAASLAMEEERNLTRGLIAGLAAVALLCLGVMVGRRVTASTADRGAG